MSEGKKSVTIKTFDDILIELGSPGRYRILLFLMQIGIIFPVGLNIMFIIFTAFVPKHYCKTTSGANTSVSSENLRNASSLGSCELWLDSNNHSIGTTSCIHGMEYELVKGEWFVSNELNLVCDRKYVKTIGLTFQYTGIMLGGVIFGHISDRYGRRKSLIASTVLQFIFGIALAFTNSAISFFICGFFLGISLQGMHSSAFTASSELFHANHRTYQGMIMNIPWALSLIIVSFLFWILRRWNYVQMVIAFSSFIPFVYVWFMPESLRWLMTKGKVEEAYTEYKKFRTFNKQNVNPSIKEDLQRISSRMVEYQTETEKASYAILFQSARMMKCTCILGAIYFLSEMLFLEVNFVIPKLGGNKYVCYMISGSLETIAIVSSLFVFQRFGRRIPLMSVMVISSISFGICSFTRHYLLGGETVSEYMAITFALLGMLMLIAVTSVLSLYMTEVFPTLLRGTGVSFVVMCGRMGGIMAPAITLLEIIWDPLPIFLCSVCGFISGLSVLMLPETNKKPLPDSVAELQNLYSET